MLSPYKISARLRVYNYLATLLAAAMVVDLTMDSSDDDDSAMTPPVVDLTMGSSDDEVNFQLLARSSLHYSKLPSPPICHLLSIPTELTTF